MLFGIKKYSYILKLPPKVQIEVAFIEFMNKGMNPLWKAGNNWSNVALPDVGLHCTVSHSMNLARKWIAWSRINHLQFSGVAHQPTTPSYVTRVNIAHRVE